MRPVTFLLPDEPALGTLGRLDPDRSWERFQQAERAWTLQTYLRLKAAGLEVELANEMPERGVVLFHAASKRSVVRRSSFDGLLVAIRGDRRAVPWADVEIVQEPASACPGRAYYVTHWPQPGLKGRDPGRGAALRRIAYKGFADNLDPSFRSPRWLEGLRDRGLEFVDDSVAYRAGSEAAELDWPNYSDIDAVLAVRPPAAQRDKPPTKLINAWLAGVPALLGNELSYRAMREHPFDYFEVSTDTEALARLDELKRDESLYLAMVEHGRRRGAAFDVPALVRLWERLLFEELPEDAAGRASRRRRGPAWRRWTVR